MNKYIFSVSLLLVLNIFSVAAFAGLKKDAVELSHSNDPNNIEKLIAAILESPKLDLLPGLGLTIEQLESIFGALQKAKSDNAQKLFFKILNDASWHNGLFKNAMLLIADYVSRINSLAEDTQKSLKSQENQADIERIFSNSFQHSVDAQDIKSLMTVLEWEDFDQDTKEWLLRRIPTDKLDNLFDMVRKTKPDNPGKLFFTLLDASNFTDGLFKHGMQAIASYVSRIDSLSEEARNLLKAKENQNSIENIFSTSFRHLIDAQDIKSLISILDWKDFNQFHKETILNTIIKQQKLAEIVPSLYKTNMEQFSKMIFSDEAKLVVPEDDTLPSAEPSKVICNQEGYDDGVTISCELGRPIKLDDDTPIGYNVHLPNGEVKAILTRVYGGHEAKNRKERMYYPKDLDALDKYLLAHGVAIVYLNLVDLRELKAFQGVMPEDIHRRLHASINKYFQEFQAPGNLHKDLAVLQGKANFLYGGSFGGRTAARHAQLHPKTFKGYISQDGALFFARMDRTNPLILGKEFSWAQQKSQNWLDPINEIAKIQDPVLASHYLDDNTVSPSVSIGFYEEGVKNKLGDLVRLLLTTKGGPIPSAEKIHLKGHFLPQDPASLKRLGAYILRFMLKGPSAVPAASELSAHMHKLLTFGKTSGQYFTKDRLKNEVYRHYLTSGKADITDKVWDAEYLPILEALYLVEFYGLTKESPELKANAKIIEGKIANKSFEDLAYSNAIKLHALTFAEYLIEKYQLPIVDKQLLSQIIIDSKEIREIFKTWIGSFDTSGHSLDFNKFLLQEFLVANPSIVSSILQVLFPDGIPDNLNDLFKKVRSEFEIWLGQSKSIATKTWQQAVSAMIAKQRTQYLEKFTTLAATLTTPTFQDISAIRAQFEELLNLAAPLLSNLALVPDIRATYKKLVEQHEQCQSTHCRAYYASSLLSLGLLMGNKNFMKESVLKAAEALKAIYPLEKNLSDIVIIKYVAPLMNKLNEKNRLFSPEDLKSFEEAIPEL